MTITVAVTGGIGAGKSTVSGLLAARGAVVVDSDRLAREVVGVGTPGLAAVAEQFGIGVLADDGSLNRAALAGVVFADPEARSRLEAITHPLVRARFAELRAAAPTGSVVVNDIPLLTNRAAAAAFHLVIGVGAPEGVRIQRLVGRGLSAADAAARIAAQIDDETRRRLCDVWLDNSAGPAEIQRSADRLWARLAEFAENVNAGRSARRVGTRLLPYDPDWPGVADRITARLRYLVGDRPIEHLGSTAVVGRSGTGVIDLSLTVADLGEADDLGPVLTAGGFPVDDRPDDLAPDQSAEESEGALRMRANADPGQSVNLYLRLRQD